MFGFEVAARREQERRAKESDPVQQFLEQKRERKHPHLVFVSDETAHRQEEPRQEQSLETELVGFRLVKPLTCAAENLNRAAVYEMLGPVWVLGENGKFDQVKAIVAAEEEKPVTSWEELLKLAMIYHQVSLHFLADDARVLARRGLHAVNLLSSHPLGPIVDTIVQVARWSLLYSLENNVEAKKAHLDRLREFVVKYGPENVFPRYVFGVRNWRRLGDMAQFAEIVVAAQGSDKIGRLGDDSYCPKALLSWVLMRVLFHNVKVAKRRGEMSRKEQKATSALLRSLVDRVVAADERGQGARSAASALTKELVMTGLIKP